MIKVRERREEEGETDGYDKGGGGIRMRKNVTKEKEEA